MKKKTDLNHLLMKYENTVLNSMANQSLLNTRVYNNQYQDNYSQENFYQQGLLRNDSKKAFQSL